MLRYLNKIIRGNYLRRAQGSRKGQVAVILILVAAAGLVFYAITLNLGRISQTKSLVTIASNTAASQLASQMASYGQEVSERELGGQFKKCNRSGVLRAIIMAIIIVVIAIVCTACSVYLTSALYVVAATTVILQVAVIEPALTRKWNILYRNLKTVQDLYTEQGIMAGLQAVVTDRVRVPDLFDEDQDRVWGYAAGGAPLDTISRFGIYYTERLKSIEPGDITDIQVFIAGLKQFLYENSAPLDNWALIDSAVGCSTSECNPCCVPAVDPLDTTTPLRPEECGTDEGAIEAACAAASPYGSDYPWVYDPFYENPGNGFLSLREQLGRDDEHQLFRKNPLGPNGIQVQTGAPPPPLPPDNFLIEDTTGFYVPTVYPPTDNRRGVFSYFYKLADWRLDLTAWNWDPLVFNPPANNPVEQCYWVAQAWAPYGPLCAAVTLTMPLELQSPMSLPNDPSTLSQNTTLYVDGDNNRTGSGFPPLNAGDPPLATDRIGAFGPADPLRAVVADQDLCAEKILTNPSGQGFWKKGGDRFCSAASPPAWPYSENCPKEAGCGDPLGCICEENITPPENWPDDALDAIVYGVREFITDAEKILAIGDDVQIAAQFETWYPDIAQWIEPGTGSPPTGSGAVAGTDCFVCNAEDGKLVTMYKMIREMKQRLERLRDTSYASAPGVCDEAWCVPGTGCLGGKDSSALGGLGPEENTFDSNGNGARGDFADVAACLNWNVNDRVTTTSSSPVTATGNYEKFRECDNACTDVRNNVNLAQRAVDADDLCSTLPRSLVPGFDALPFVRPTPLLLMCADSCNTCITACAGNAACIAACGCGGCACSDSACLSTQTANAKGSCTDTGAGGFITLLQKSIPEAQNQVPKFQRRLTFLQSRLTEINNTIGILNNAEIKFNDFLACPAGPACRLIQARINNTNQAQASGLPYQVIYGWQDESTTDTPIGRWHIVKVDARVPKKCENTCGVGGSSDPLFPWVRTYSKGFLKSTRCYEMTDTDGMVKVRVTRFDESKGSPILFPNGVPLWEFRYDHPDRPAGDSEDPGNPYNLVGLDSSCRTSTIRQLPDGPATDIYLGAFIMNERLEPSPDPPTCFLGCAGNSACQAACLGNVECWNRALSILTRGVTTDTCAKYYWHEGMNNGMGFKFVPCPNF